ncbi:hypothetical protein ACIBKX_33890 [Streptomyces sp. NPDC050658]|uniref:hypothetical protein n=1 Tax=unclassified Streptomyces TaxID=2593676 RepID=UPI00341B90B0
MSIDLSLHSSTRPLSSLVVRGGAPVHGTVTVSGFKHVQVLAIAYAIGVGRRTVLTNVPDILETRTYLDLLPRLGIDITQAGSSLLLAPGAANNPTAGTAGPGAVLPNEAASIHGSLYLLPALLALRGRVGFSSFGGCPIGSTTDEGSRPWRHIVRVVERFGARFDERRRELTLPHGGFRATELDLGTFADDQRTLTGPEYSGATKAAVLTAAFAEGTTVLHRPYQKAELRALLDLLKQDGVGVTWSGGSLEITPHARPGDLLTYDLPPDLLEVVTWTTVAAVTGGAIQLANVTPELIKEGLSAEHALWHAAGVRFTRHPGGGITVRGPLDGAFASLPEIRVDPTTIYSDSQPLFTVLATQCPGPTRLVDGVWTGRYRHLDGLAALGADTRRTPDGAVIGDTPLRAAAEGTWLRATDLRCAAALVVAALASPGGPVQIGGTQHLERGYDHLPQKLAACLANAPLQPTL